MTAARALMTGLVDYAGLFPPAGMGMAEAVRQYRAYLTGKERWVLGRFVVPATRLKEFRAAFEEVCCGEREPVWRLSALNPANEDLFAGAPIPRGAVQVDSVEMKAGSADVETLLKGWTGPQAYVGFAPGDAEEMLPVLKRYEGRAKIRMGGVTTEAFPGVNAVVEFLTACAREKVAFKATAGLHHAVRGEYKLTYEAESEKAKMHGFVNVFLAAVLAWRGEETGAVKETLEVEDAASFAFGRDGVKWLEFEAKTSEIEAARREFAMSYGSCSFEEPVAEAKAAGWI